LKKWLMIFLIASLFSGIRIVHAADSPSARIGPAMVYDHVNKRVLLFGGSIYENGRYTFYNDLWSFADGEWTEINVPGTKPSGRFNIPMVYLPDTNQIFIFGGFSSTDRIGDTWIYDIAGNQWTRLSTDANPPRRSDVAIAYDEEHNVVVMFGGYGLNDNILDDTWVFDFSLMNWVEMSPQNKPLNQYGGHMEYDSMNGVLLMYPGHWEIISNGELIRHGYGDEIWIYNYAVNDWIELETTPNPMGRYWFNLAYDTKTGELVLFGGSIGGDNQLSDTWLYDYASNSWRQIATDTKPPVRANSYMVYDESRDTVVLFGGSHFNHEVYSDTWTLDMESETWSEISSEPSGQSQETPQGIPGFSVYAIALSLMVAIWVHRCGKIKV
jgi:Galactose oxidase, central domain